MKFLADLSVRLGANTANLTENLGKAQNSVKRYSKEAEKASKQNQKAMNQIKGSISGLGSFASSELSKVTGGLSDMLGALKGVGGGVMGLTGSFKGLRIAIAGTGIGLLVIALGSLVTYFKSTKEGSDMLTKAMSGIQSVVTTIIKRLGILGESIVLLFQRKFKQAADKAKEAVSGIGEEIKENYEIGKNIGEAEAKLQREKIYFLEKEAKMLAEIQDLKTKADQTDTYTEEERLALISKAINLQKDLAKERISLSNRELAIQEKRIEMAGGEGKVTNEELQKTVALRTEVFKIKEDESSKLSEMLSKQREINKLLKEQAEPQKIEGQGANINYNIGALPDLSHMIKPVTIPIIPEINIADFQSILQEITESVLKVVDTIGSAFASIDGLFSASMEKRMIQLDNHYNREAELINNSYMTEESKAEALAELDAQTEAKKKALAKKQAKMDKANAIFGAVVATAQGVAKALTMPPPLSFAMAAVTGALGLAQVATISSTPLPAYANGTGAGGAVGGLSLVGERGAELVNLPAGAEVTRANKTEQLLAGARAIEVFITSRIEGEDLVQVVEKVQERQTRNF